MDASRLTNVARGSMQLARAGSVGQRVRAVVGVLTHPATGARLAAAQSEQAEALQALDDKPILIGHSFGGLIVQHVHVGPHTKP